MDLALLEDDLDSVGFLSPHDVDTANTRMPERAVFCFFEEMIQKIAASPGVQLIETLVWAHGAHPVYRVEHRGEPLAVVHAGVGAPLAAGLLEETIALGGRSFVSVGGAGVLVPDLVVGHAIVVDSAVRDEGTSFHYVASSRYIDVRPDLVRVVEQTLVADDIPFVTGRAWTTDAPYREARTRVDRRVKQDECLAVEMEASALLAVAAFRGVNLVALLYAGDSLAGDNWDHRGWDDALAVREAIFWAAADVALNLPLPE